MRIPWMPPARPLALLALIAWASATAAMAGEEDEILARSMADARALAARLPGPEKLGADWLLPWRVPASSGRSTSEEAYWSAFEKQSLPAGITESHARAMAESAAQNAAQTGIPGFTSRVGMVNLLRMLRGQLGTAAEKASDTADEMVANEAAGKAGAARTPEAAAKAQALYYEALAAPYKAMDDEALKRLFVAQTTRVAQRTRMEYLRSNDWTKAGQSTLPPGVWVGVVTVTLSIVKDDRLAEVPDMNAAQLAALEKRVNDGYRALHAASAPELMKMARTRIDSVVKNIDYSSRPPTQGTESEADRAARLARLESLQRERDELQRMASSLDQPPSMRILARQFGDNSYVLRLTNALPGVMGASVSMYTGWLRNGPALVEIKLGGNFPEAEMNQAMDHFLQEMDAHTDVYRQ